MSNRNLTTKEKLSNMSEVKHAEDCDFEQTMNGIEFTSNHPEANVTVLKETDQPCLRAVGFEEVFELRMNFCPVCGVCLTPKHKKG